MTSGTISHPRIAKKESARLAGNLVILLAIFGLAASAAPRIRATNDDVRVLRTMFQAQFARYVRQPNNDPAVREIGAAFAAPRDGSRGMLGDPAKAYQALAKGLGIMALGSWDERREMAALLDMRLPAKLAEPGETVQVRIGPLYERSGPLSGEYLIRVGLTEPSGAAIGEAVELPYRELEEKDVALQIPPPSPRATAR